MDLNEGLNKLGLTESESIIYASVLKLGICTVKNITKECGFHRTNIYDILDQLIEKGLITSYKEGNVAKYQVTNPEALKDFLKEKEETLSEIFPDIMKLHNIDSEHVKVEVFKGSEGMKTAFRDQIREKKPIYGYGVKGQLREKLPIFAKQYLRDLKANKIPYNGIYTEGEEPSYYTEIKYLSEEYSSPVATFIYGDKININIWEPSLVAIVITSKLVADMYKKHFDLLWTIAK